MKNMKFLFPGNLGANVIIVVFGIIMIIAAFLAKLDSTTSSLLVAVGASLFIAGFLGIVHLKVLSIEINKVASQPIEDLNLMTQIRSSGIEGVSDDRDRLIDKMMYDIKEENDEIVIVGSSLKGLIGVGYNSSGSNQKFRDLLIDLLEKNVKINILMTNPEIAHHRSQQEGRDPGGIEAEIIKNLMYFTKIRNEHKTKAQNLNIKLYRGTPTIFMIALSKNMMINPYPYYSTAYNSYSFLIRGGSDLYRGYFKSHYQMAWDSSQSESIPSDINLAKAQIEKFINGKNEHESDIIQKSESKTELMHELNQLL
ncbi:MAG: hypothetical protein IH598_01715 [Bacteroidales bacterium]|nr:hypothetical protein [Bacteroidales bacterium]